MTASETLYHAVHTRLWMVMRPAGVRATTVCRLALLIVGVLVGQKVVGRQMVAALQSLPWGATVSVAAVRRRVQRALADRSLQAGTGYAGAVQVSVDWDAARRAGEAVMLIVDETSQEDRVHQLRVGLAYRGTALPLAWRTWAQNEAQPHGAYWQAVDDVLDQAGQCIPSDLPVVVTADRAFDIPTFIDRVAARGWHWIVRAKGRAGTLFRRRSGESASIGTWIERRLGTRRGARWKSTGAVFKKAGWRPASLVLLRGADGPLAVLSDLPARTSLLAQYRQRFWIEVSFRNDKALGWDWEHNRIPDPGVHAALLLTMAWATLIVLCLGCQDAALRLAGLRTTGRPQHARASLFTLGRQRLRLLLVTGSLTSLPWQLPHGPASTWDAIWRAAQIRLHLWGVKTVTP